MPSFFPHYTVEWKLEEPRAFRRLTLSLVEMAAITGVLLRIFRSFALTHGSNGWLYLGGMFALGLLFLLLMVTAHLANFPIQRWAWRAPLFALVEWGAEMATSLLLIGVGREPYGTVRATMHDWPAMAVNALATRGLGIVLWTLLLAAIVQIVRRIMAASVEAETEEEKEEVTA
jgi:hypothetical protein